MFHLGAYLGFLFFYGVNASSIECVRKKYGGHARNRTGVHGFAIRCVTTPPRGLLVKDGVFVERIITEPTPNPFEAGFVNGFFGF